MAKTSLTSAIIPAAGASTRLNKKQKKQFIEICGHPLIYYSLKSFQESPLVDEIVVVTTSDEIKYVKSAVVDNYSISKVTDVVEGGLLRQDSVKNGFGAISPGSDIVIIHDAARPLVNTGFIDSLIKEVKNKNCVISAIPVRDTLKVAVEGKVRNTYPRESFWRAQTPQAFKYTILNDCYEKDLLNGAEFTDESQLVEYAGYEVSIIEGSEYNFKITTEEDLHLAKLLMNGGAESV